MINGFPAPIQNILEQQNFLETKLRRSLHAKYILRAAAARKSMEYFEGRIGETKTFTRSNPITPNIAALSPAANSGLDNGVTLATRGYEQWYAELKEYPYGINLNVLGQEAMLADLFLDYSKELADAAANSLEVISVITAFQSYEDYGDTFVESDTTGTTSALHVDNTKGFDTQYPSANAPSYGIPQATSTLNKMPIMVLSSTGVVRGVANVTAVVLDGSNVSYMQQGTIAFGTSGVLTLDAPIAGVAHGDRVVSLDASNPSITALNPIYKDGSWTVRPLNASSSLMEPTAYQMAATDIFNPTVQVPYAVSLLKRRQVPPLANGLYGCMVDATLMSQLYQDAGFQRATATRFDGSPVFTNGTIAKGWGVEFIDASQIPVYVAPNGSFPLRQALVFGEDIITEHPFAAARDAQSIAARQGDIVDVRWVDNIEFINQAPLDRLNEVVKMSYKYVGDFKAGTDKGSNPSVVFTSDYSRFKRGVTIQAASPI